MMKKRDRDHKSLWNCIKVIGESEDDKLFYLDPKGRLIEKFPKSKPRRDLYNKEFLDSLQSNDSNSDNDQLDITVVDSVLVAQQDDQDEFFDFSFGAMSQDDQFGFFPEIDTQIDFEISFDL